MMFSLLNKSLEHFSQTTVFDRIISTIEGRRDPISNLLRVVTYHRVDDPARNPHLDPSLISATPQAFAEQMAVLASRYTPVTMTDVLAALRDQQPLPERAVLVTFDDAYQDFEEIAWPVMQALEIPATVFVPTAFPGDPYRCFWWDQMHHHFSDPSRSEFDTPWGPVAVTDSHSRRSLLKQFKRYLKSISHSAAMCLVEQMCSDGSEEQPVTNHVLSWEQLRTLHADGVTIAPHTHTHPMLDRVSPDVFRTECMQSLEELRTHVSPDITPVLAYPSGHVPSTAEQVLSEIGIHAAFTTRRGQAAMGSQSRYELPRINVGGRTSPALLRAQMIPPARHVCNWIAR